MATLLRWPANTYAKGRDRRATLICFNPTRHLLHRVHTLYLKGQSKSQAAEQHQGFSQDPYLAISLVSESWFKCVNDRAWQITDNAKEVEEVRRRRRSLNSTYLPQFLFLEFDPSLAACHMTMKEASERDRPHT
jgi:hypothetical protein